MEEMEAARAAITRELLKLSTAPNYITFKRSLRKALNEDKRGHAEQALALFEVSHCHLINAITVRQEQFLLDSLSDKDETAALKELVLLVERRAEELGGDSLRESKREAVEMPSSPVRDPEAVGFLSLLKTKDVAHYVDFNAAKEADEFDTSEFPLHDAIQLGNVAEVARMLNLTVTEVDGKGCIIPVKKPRAHVDRALVNSATPKKRRTPLHLAVLCLQNSETELIIEMLVMCYKVDANAVDERGYTPLQLAVEKLQFKNAVILLRAGKRHRPTLLHSSTADKGSIALDSIPEDPVEEKAKGGKKKKGFLKKSVLGHVNKERAPPKPLDFRIHCNESSATALILACCVPFESECELTDYTELIDVLIHADFNTVNQPNDKGETPLHLAVFNHNCFAVSLLLSYGANSNAVTKQNSTALHYGVWSGQRLVIEMLLRNGADPSIVADNYGTPLDLASQLQLAEVVEVLEQHSSGKDAPKVVLPTDVLNLPAAATLPKLSPRSRRLTLGSEVLDLSGQALTVLSLDQYMHSLATASVLDLRFNNLEAIPPILGSFEHLDVLLEGNPLTMMPEKCRAMPWPKLRSYLRQLTTRMRQWAVVKLLLVGPSGSGKSSLVSALDRASGIAKKEEGSGRTIGVKMTHDLEVAGKAAQQLATRLTKAAPLKRARTLQTLAPSTQFTVCDLAGQSLFYPLHQFFLSYSGVYVVTISMADLLEEACDASTNRRDQRAAKCLGIIDYWLRQIRSLGSLGPKVGPGVLIVGTHTDELSKQDHDIALDKLLHAFPRKRHPFIADVLTISTTTGKGTGKLKRRLLEISNDQLQRSPAPRSPKWLLFKDFVDEKSDAQPSTTWQQFKNWANRLGINDGEILDLTGFLSNAGSCIHFSENFGVDDTHRDGLSNLVILNPQWLADTISTVMTVSSRISTGKPGRLCKSDMPQILSNFTSESWDSVTQLLEDCELIHRIDEQEWLLPSQLPEHQPDGFAKAWPALLPLDLFEHGRVFEFEFFPVQLFSKLLVRLVRHTDLRLCHELCWKQGIVVALGEQTGFISYVPRRSSLNIAVRLPTEDAKKSAHDSLLRKIVETFATLVECVYSSRSLDSVRQLCPCIHCIQQRVVGQTPFYFTFEECMAAVTSGQLVLYCKHIKSLSRSVRVDQLAPDVSLVDLPHIKPSLLEDTGVILGQGGFGVVRKCIYRGEEVAVKELKCELGPEEFNEFQREAYISSGLCHPNILTMYGVSRSPLRMILELAPAGDLYHYMHKQDETPAFPWKLRLKICLDIARGLQYLHSLTPPVVHRDFRSPNIFLFHTDPERPEPAAKVADFGLSREAAGGMSGAIMTWRWAAPEAINGLRFDERADVYSLGIVLWEIVSMAQPFEEYEDMSAVAIRGKVVSNGLRPTIPQDCPKQLAEIIRGCWETSPSGRLPINDVVSGLAVLAGVRPEDLDREEAPRLMSIARIAAATATVRELPTLPADTVVLHQRLSCPAKAVVAESFEDTIVVGMSDGKVMLLQRREGPDDMESSWSMLGAHQCHQNRIESITALGSSCIVTSSVDGHIVVWKVDEALALRMELSWTPFNHGHASCMALVTSTTGMRSLWIGSPWGEVRVFDASSLKLLHSIVAGEKYALQHMEQLYDTVWVAAGSTILVYSITSLELLYSWQAPAAVSCLLAVGSLMFASSGAEILAWRCATRKEVKFEMTLSVHSGTIKDLITLGGFLVSCSFDKTIVVWDLRTLNPVQEITGHAKDTIASLAGTPDLRWLVSVSGTSVFVWECFEVPEPLEDSLKSPEEESEDESFGGPLITVDTLRDSLEVPNPRGRPRHKRSRSFADVIAQGLGLGVDSSKSSATVVAAPSPRAAELASPVPPAPALSVTSEEQSEAAEIALQSSEPHTPVRIVSKKKGIAVGNCLLPPTASVRTLFESLVPENVSILKAGRIFALEWKSAEGSLSSFFELDMDKPATQFLSAAGAVYLQAVTAAVAESLPVVAEMTTNSHAAIRLQELDEDDI